MSQIHPPKEIVDKFIDTVLQDAFTSIANEIQAAVRSEIYVYSEKNRILHTTISSGKFDKELRMQVKIRFKEAFGDRYIMFGESMLEREKSVTGCSGFSMKAEYKSGNVKKKNQTIRYNVWDWTGWV